MKKIHLTPNRIILGLSVYAAVLFNIGFWQDALAATVSDEGRNWFLVLTMPLFMLALLNLLFQLLFWPWLHRIVVPFLLIAGASVAYSVMVQGIYFNSDQLINVLQTTPNEVRAFASFKFAAWTLFAGVLPAVFYLLFVRVHRAVSWWRGLLWRVVSMVVSLLVIAGIAASGFSDYAAFSRNNHALSHKIVPLDIIGAAVTLMHNNIEASKPFRTIGEDATRTASAKKRILVLVVGETTRAENWGLNEGAPPTTPRLAAENGVINFPDAHSCGTSTAQSVPCLFAPQKRKEFNLSEVRRQENLLDVLKRVGLDILWRENDSGCKGVCDRVETIDMYRVADPSRCRAELCDDHVLLDGLKEEIEKMKGDGVIVLHTVGSHGPAYFERYAPEFRRFTPTCDTNQIQDCDPQALRNTYNNTVLNVDDMLAGVIDVLKGLPESTDAAMLYFSDHGESLGEKGLYLHGAPYAVAPSQQTHIPMIFWADRGFYQSLHLNESCLKARARQESGHDNVFASVLGMFDVSTTLYKAEDDLFAGCRTGGGGS